MNSWQINDSLRMNSLIIQYHRRATNTSHVGFIPFPGLLVVAYGRIDQGRFRLSVQDEYPYEDFPQIKGIHDGVGWNIPLITGFLGECLAAEIEEAALEIQKEGSND